LRAEQHAEGLLPENLASAIKKLAAHADLSREFFRVALKNRYAE
jgi:hypothetical protein